MDGLFAALRGIIGVLTGINILMVSIIGILVRPLYRRLNQVRQKSSENEIRIAVLSKNNENQNRQLGHIQRQVDRLVNQLIEKGKRG